jgi:hypothetical protein
MPSGMDLTAPCRQATRLLTITPNAPAHKYRRRHVAGLEASNVKPGSIRIWWQLA